MDKLLALFIIYLTLVKATFFLPAIPDVLFYGSFLFVFALLLVRGRNLSFTVIYLPFFVAILLSIAVNDTPAVFQVPLRFAGFCAIVFLVGPFCRNTLLDMFRRRLFAMSLWSLEWLILCSFIGYILGIPWMKVGEDFRGFSTYSMMTGPLAGIAFLYCLYLFYLAETKKQKSIVLIKTVICLLVVVLAGSRAALGSSLVGLLFFIGKIYHFRLNRIFQVGLIVIVLAASTVSYWLPMAERIVYKMDYGEEQGSSTASRDLLWTSRLNEFKEYPFFGIGFASIKMEQGIHSTVGSGTIEPGSSWLFLLSSLGIVGFLSFLFPLLSMFYNAYRSDDERLKKSFLGSLLLFLMAHMLFEGYVIASGTYLCFFLWLLLSECYVQLYKK